MHVLCTTADDFQKMEEKQKLPKPKLTKEIKEKLQIILTKRLERYPKVIVNDVLLSVTKTNVI